jgi:hypothetical protein
MIHESDPEAYLIGDHECNCDLSSVSRWAAQEAFKKGLPIDWQYSVKDYHPLQLHRANPLPKSKLVNICLSHHRLALDEGPNLV